MPIVPHTRRLDCPECDRLTSFRYTQQERWAILIDTCRQFGFAEVRRMTDGTLYRAESWEASETTGWSLRIPLADGGYVNYTRPAESDDKSLNMSTFVKTVSHVLSQPLAPVAETSRPGFSSTVQLTVSPRMSRVAPGGGNSGD